MSRKIFKYPLSLENDQVIELPFGAKILAVQQQFNVVCLWAMVDPEINEFEKRIFRIIGTGHEMLIGEKFDYLGTVQVSEGHLVWHVFEELA